MGAGSKHEKPARATDGAAVSLALPQNMTIEMVDELLGEVRQFPLMGKVNVVLDAAGLDHITTSGIQLILSLEKTVTAGGGSLRINNIKDSVQRAFRDIGLERLTH